MSTVVSSATAKQQRRTQRMIRSAEIAAAGWYASYMADVYPLWRSYRYEDEPWWRDGYDAAMHGADDVPYQAGAFAGWLCGEMASLVEVPRD